jgi:glucose-6-phosphate 1-dehydrogenase
VNATKQDSKPTTFVIFGATGDLTRRKLVPALFHLYRRGSLPTEIHVVGFARRGWSHDEFRAALLGGMREFASGSLDPTRWSAFAERLWYVRGDLDSPDDYLALRKFCRDIEKGPSNRLYYTASAPEFYVPIVRNLTNAEMVEEPKGWRRVVIEKPFGHDLESAHELNRAVHEAFDEHQVYRIDHYLGKETAQNILFFRFANTIFEPIWNRNYIDNIQITVAETVDIGHRAGYYDHAGVFRDMFQNHLLQLLALTAMEPPASFVADAVRDERAKLLSAIRPMAATEIAQHVVRGQYAGYRDADGVANDSRTPTFGAVRLFIDNWRWQGVPFYLRSGKALAQRTSNVAIEFKCPPHMMFPKGSGELIKPNLLVLCIQPLEGMRLRFEIKVPETLAETRSVDMKFDYDDAFGSDSIPDAYVRLLLDAMNGDASLFTRSDGIEMAWRWIDPIVRYCDAGPRIAVYEKGTWGPDEAIEFIARTGRTWYTSCPRDGEER